MITKYYDRYAPADELVISNFDGGAGVEWTKLAGSGSVSDTSEGIKVVANPDNYTVIELEGNWDFTGKDFFQFNLFSNNPDNKYSSYVMISSDSEYNNYYKMFIPFDNLMLDNYTKQSFHKNEFAATGSPAWSTITHIRIGLQAKTDTTYEIIFSKLKAFANSLSKGIVIPTFDGGNHSIYESAFPVMQANGIRSVQFITTDWVGLDMGGGLTMEKSQLLEMQIARHDISSHSKTHINLLEATESQIESELRDSQVWLKTHGFKGYRFFASAFGAYNSASVISKIRQYYDIHRPTENGFNSAPLLQPLAVGHRYPLSNVSSNTVKEWIDQAANNGQILILTFHKVKETEDNEYDYSVAKFTEVCEYIAQKKTEGVIDDVHTFSEYLAKLSITGVTSDDQNVYVQGEGFLGKDGNANPNAVKLGGVTKTPTYITDTQMVIPR